MEYAVIEPFSSLVEHLSIVNLEDVQACAQRIKADIASTPLLRFMSCTDRQIHLKPECLQPLGSFKIRGGVNAIAMADQQLIRGGVATASAGNFAQGLALAAKRRSIPITVHAPESAASTKLDAITRLGAQVVLHPFEDWWQIMDSRQTGQADGMFVHPVCETAVIIGNSTIGLEIAQEWADVETVIVPFGGGGLAVGVALGLQAIGSNAKVVACEVETSTPLAAAFAAGAPVSVERTPSFVDGIGSLRVLDPMWPLIKRFVDRSITVSVEACRQAVRDAAFDAGLVIEGAAAAALAAARHPDFAGQKVVALLTGRNIDQATFRNIIERA